jgi:membrane protein
MLRWITRRLWPVLCSTWNGWGKDNGALLSAATAYYAAFSMFPLCLVLIASLGVVGRYSSSLRIEQHDLIVRLSQNVSPWVADQLETILNGVQARALLGGPLGLLALILTAIGVFMQLETIFARIWGTRDPSFKGWLAAIRAVLWSRALGFLTLLAIGALLMAVFFVDVIFAGIRPFFVDLPAGRWGWRLLQTSMTIGCDTLLLTTIYKVFPHAHVPWKAALGGGLLAAAVWAVGRSVLLSLVVGNQYSAYGIVGAMMGVMFWFYYASAVVFLGAEFVRALSQESPQVGTRT